MPGHTNQDESTWYYHSPFVNNKSEKPAPKPLMSQIPGINGCQDDRAAGSNRPYYKDTDSKYVRLAKQGGTKDLLNYTEFDQPKKAVAYARNDWFYLEDNAAEDAKNKKDANWKFGVPEYMANASRSLESGDQTHELQKLEALRMADNGQTHADPIHSPHTGEQLPNPSMDYHYPTVSDRETRQVCSDKTGNPPEMKSERSQMSQAFPPHYSVERARAVIPEPEYRNPILQNDYFETMPPASTRKYSSDRGEHSEANNSLPAGYTRRQSGDKEGRGQVSMSKLLSHDYGKEWHAQLKDTQPGPRRGPFTTAQEANFQAENYKRDKSGDEEENRKIQFIDNGRSMDEFEISKADPAPESIYPNTVNQAHNSRDLKNE